MTLFLKEWKKYFTFAAMLSCFVNILQLTFPFYMFTIYRNILVSFSMVSLENITAVAVFAIMVLAIFSYLRSRLLSVAGRKLTLSLRQDVYATMVKGCAVNSQIAYRGGAGDLDTLRNFFSSPGIYALFDAVWAPFYLGLIFLFHPVLGLIALCGVGGMVGLSILQENLVGRRIKEANRLNAENYRFVDSFLRNTEVINGMGMITAISDRFILGNSRVMDNQTLSSYYAGMIQAIIKPAQNVIQVLIYCFGAYYAMHEGFNVGLMVAASIIMGRGVGPLMQVMSSWRLISSAKLSYERISRMAAHIEAEAINESMSLPKPAGHIRAESVLFSTGGRVLLNNISFDLAPGEFLGIVGPNGAGKTTLCRLLLGIWPTVAGRITLDGKDMFSWSKSDLGRHIGYLPQEIELFPGSMAENISRLGEIDSDALDKAVELSGIADLVSAFPRGLGTKLEGKDGIRLSGGQRQRIGLARALYGSPSFVVLDEPSSNMDEQSEALLAKNLELIKSGRDTTCIMVTHKPELLHVMDKILVLNKGQAVLFGARDDVLSKLAGGEK
ncbi:type I secretion system permease/ATPase [Desulfobacter curvatus]|uniref:type I secretion system permease/ATPase n=1 Tax=Desulfobacter curvatus TaxID=2290 RepID=UPI00037EAC75|nr:type I secretion system permease/ATPase [Desulfobacter curvatus]